MFVCVLLVFFPDNGPCCRSLEKSDKTLEDSEGVALDVVDTERDDGRSLSLVMITTRYIT